MTPEQLQSLLDQAEPWLRGAAGAALLFWLLVIIDRKRWWPGQWSLHLDAAATQAHPDTIGEITVIVPARNEAVLMYSF